MNKRIGIWILLLLTGQLVLGQSHPSIMLTKKNMAAVRAGVKTYPMFRKSFEEVQADADKAVGSSISVPTPKDGGGGITHEQHKNNYKAMLACGVSYQVTGNVKYAKYVKDMLLQYAAVYNTWPAHPKRKKGHMGGKMFWQNLNDCVWQVYTIQGYDCVYDYLSAADRRKIEDSLFVPIIKELTEVNYDVFNKIHNHGTWSAAAVGMTGYVCGRKEWVEMALKGSKKDGSTGFLKQLDQLFSPDGYFAEGPYYQRYAIQPFIIFAKAINAYQPELKIYDYRNGLLRKAVSTDLQCTYTNKVFFPVNDALKDKTYETEELVYAVDIAYGDMGATDDLLDIAQQQKRVIVSDVGLKVAKAIAEGKARPFVYKPMWIKDGATGNDGGLGILRKGSNADQTCVVFKAASQGMGHGHFDRLNMLLYDNNVEVLQDYGAARFLNIETKTGGGYTKENDTYAHQTIAHNTLVADKTSHYKGEETLGEKSAPSLLYFKADDRIQVVAAEENKAYADVNMLRTVALFTPDGAESPLTIDVFKAISTTTHRYDLPFWYNGHLTNVSFPYKTNGNQLSTLGTSYGYQHIWLNAEGKVNNSNGAITFLNNKKFYTTTFLCDTATRVEFVTSGANDPDFNLRNEKAYIITQPAAANHTFINITEPHGKNNPIAEFTVGFSPVVKNIRLINDSVDATTFSFDYNKRTYTVQLQYKNKEQFITIK